MYCVLRTYSVLVGRVWSVLHWAVLFYVLLALRTVYCALALCIGLGALTLSLQRTVCSVLCSVRLRIVGMTVSCALYIGFVYCALCPGVLCTVSCVLLCALRCARVYCALCTEGCALCNEWALCAVHCTLLHCELCTVHLCTANCALDTSL